MDASIMQDFYSCPQCNSNHNCYYKQLKRAEKTMQEIWDRLGKPSDELLRKEQECEELRTERTNLKWDLENNIQVKNHAMEEINQLKAENEELKKEINNKYSVSNFNVIFMREHIHNLKQTLTEIKEICNNNDELKGNFNLVDCDKYKYGKHNLANKILQKISEYEVEDDYLSEHWLFNNRSNE
jgi:chromosome segregation ATPase